MYKYKQYKVLKVKSDIIPIDIESSRFGQVRSAHRAFVVVSTSSFSNLYTNSLQNSLQTTRLISKTRLHVGTTGCGGHTDNKTDQ